MKLSPTVVTSRLFSLALAGLLPALSRDPSVDHHFQSEPTGTNRWVGDLPSSPCGLRRGAGFVARRNLAKADAGDFASASASKPAPATVSSQPGGAGAAERPAFDAAAILTSRAKKDDFMRNHPQSPFRHDPAVTFAPLKYFPPDRAWVFRSKLQPYAQPEAVTILDTKGRRREGVIYGFLTWVKDGRSHTLRVYRMATPGGGFHHAVWFTDRTTGDTTYEVGRYLDFEKVDDPEHVYTLDFNLAYNPYCAYTSVYACAIPRKEDRLDLAVTAGEQKWHP